MTDIKPKKPVSKKYTALKNLCTEKGDRVAKGEEFACSEKEAKHFKKVKAI